MPLLEFLSRVTRRLLDRLATTVTVAPTHSGTTSDIIPLRNMATQSTPAPAEAGISSDSELPLQPGPTSLWATGILAGVSAIGIGLFMIAIPSPIRPPLELVERRLNSQLATAWMVACLLGAWRHSFSTSYLHL
ncbi:hypothetical protein CPB83DRAFT_300699 [Crepidotus variabilis]|uniref:Uncharacterized protein n=1 Tax=Crepidotus variabilis TaxID=179855 RepID=A0A9P6EH69_9AGAR|nr:hypothetical protein CPB83DRAFT_300699 [Crepidotus variabilis]